MNHMVEMPRARVTYLDTYGPGLEMVYQGACIATLIGTPPPPPPPTSHLHARCPPPSGTDWTHLVPPPVLTGHASSLLPY